MPYAPNKRISKSIIIGKKNKITTKINLFAAVVPAFFNASLSLEIIALIKSKVLKTSNAAIAIYLIISIIHCN